VVSPKGVSPTEALDLLKSALALHGYTLLSRAEATWIVPVDRVPFDAFTIKVVPLDYARASWRTLSPGSRHPRFGSFPTTPLTA
jgi:hypothetical protein